MTQEKNNFILGLVTGISIVLLIVLIGVSIAYFQKEDVGKVVDKKVEVDSGKAEVKKQDSSASVKKTVGKVVEKEGDYIRGNKDARVTIIEYSDFQCPYCSRFHDTMRQAMEEYPNDVRWIYRHFPLDSIHPYARKAAEASECAGDQDKFWEYADGLYDNQKSINPSFLSSLAKTLKLDTKKFEACLADGKYVSKVNDDFNEGRANGVSGTPGGFINGQKIGGAVPFSKLKPMIDSLLK